MEVLRVLNGGSDEAKFTMTNPNAAAGGHRALHTGITSRSFTSYATLATEVRSIVQTVEYKYYVFYMYL